LTSTNVEFGRADLTNCDREPIHIPGSIQPHGVLFGVDDRYFVRIASANIVSLLGIDALSAVGKPLADVLGVAAAGVICERLATADSNEPLQVTLSDNGTGSLSGQPADVVCHRSGSLWLIELEPPTTAGDSAQLSYRAARAAVSRLTGSTGLADLCDILAVEVASLCGFDRVMVYRFDAEWNGEVVSEHRRREDLNSFLGLHYPATDIPAQARALYTTNWTRLIADVNYTPAPLVPDVDPSNGAPVDLSHAVLRSVSPIHLEYLSNMGVTASMSVSLVKDGKLWGLVACHHYSGPHRPSYDERTAAEFLGQIASLLVVEREQSDARTEALASQETLRQMTVALTRDPRPPEEALAEHGQQLMDLLGATGVAMGSGQGIQTVGLTPDHASLRRIAHVLFNAEGEATYTDYISSLIPAMVPATGDPNIAAGALRVGLGPDRWLIWLRPEYQRVVDWGGDPHNKALAVAEGADVRLSPRKSFDKWREVVRGRSQPWERWDVAVAEDLRDFLNKLLIRRSREQIYLAESLQRSLILPYPPTIAGLELVAQYVPADGDQLGGDWWDALALPGGKIALAVGDVAGHGVTATAAMAQVRTALRAYLLDGHEPEAALERLDRLVASQLDGLLATAIVCLVDPATGRCEISTAGHPPPLVIAADREAGAELLRVRPRPPLGAGGGRSGQTVVVDLAAGATVVLYSDGLIERRGAPVDVCLADLTRFAQTTSTADLSDWVAMLLLAELGDKTDDSTVLAVRYAPVQPPLTTG
jgi:chemotaxis family two-component system sensor kinase Cph1